MVLGFHTQLENGVQRNGQRQEDKSLWVAPFLRPLLRETSGASLSQFWGKWKSHGLFQDLMYKKKKKKKASLPAGCLKTRSLYGIPGGFVFLLKERREPHFRTMICSERVCQTSNVSITQKSYQCEFLGSNPDPIESETPGSEPGDQCFNCPPTS